MNYTQKTIFNTIKKITLNCLKSIAMGFFSKGLKNEFECAVVNEPSVFEQLKVDGKCQLDEPVILGVWLYNYG